MLELIRKIFTPFEERVKSPFYSSFIVSWLIINWKIVYAIFSTEIKIEGLSVISYVTNQSSIWTAFVYPIILASIYVFAIPYIDEFITPIIERVKNRTLAKKLKETEASIVSGSKYVELWKQYKNVKSNFADIEKELNIKEVALKKQEDEYEAAKKELSETEKQNQIQQEKLEKLSHRNSLEFFFKGKWRIIYTTNNGTQRSDYLITFSGNQILRDEGDRGVFEYEIIYADYDVEYATTNAILKTIDNIPAFEKGKIIKLYLSHSKDKLEPHKHEGFMERIDYGITQKYRIKLNKA